MKRAALYARTSRTGQRIDVQLEHLRQVGRQRGWEIVGEFVDDDVSSRKKHRPQFAKMLKAAEAGNLDMVVAVALDRYARSTTELLGLAENLKTWGVDFISLRESIDTSTAVGKLTFTVLAALSEFERELIRERVLAGLDGARKRGKKLGRPKRQVDPVRVAELRDKGIPWSKIAAKLGASESTCRRALRTG